MGEIALSTGGAEDRASALLAHRFPDASANEPETALSTIGQIFRRRWKRIFACTALLPMLTAAALVFVTPRYSAEAVISIDQPNTQLAEFQAAERGGQRHADDTFIRSEIEVLQSPALAVAVIDALRLMNDPEFMPRSTRFEWLQSLLEHVIRLVGTYIGAPQSNLEDEVSDNNRRLERVLNQVSRRLSVTNNGRSYVIHVALWSASPSKAATIANKFAELYLARQREAKDALVNRATSWFRVRLTDLATNLAKADTAAETFRSQQGLLQADGSPVVGNELAEATAQRVLAFKNRVEKQTALEQLRQGNPSAVEVNGTLIQRLREHEASLMQNHARLLATYLPTDPIVMRMRAEIAEYRQTIQRELKRIEDNLVGEVGIATTQEEALRTRVAQLRQNVSDANHAGIRQRQLNSEAQSARLAYESFLALYTKIGGEQAIQQADAHLISGALVPATRSAPNYAMLVALAVVSGATIGWIWAVLVEQFDGRLRRTADIESITHLRILGLVPIAERHQKAFPPARAEASGADYWDGIANIRTALTRRDNIGLPRIVLITSAMPGEGKSSFAVSLASSVAQTGRKTLVVDCDLRHPSLAGMFGRSPSTAGLSDVLLADGLKAPIIDFDESSGVHFIVSGRQIRDTQFLLGSDSMRAFLRQIQSDYDFIVLDAPPILAGADALILSNLAQTTALVVRWGVSRRVSLANAARILWKDGGNLAGIVLNGVDARRHQKYTRDEFGLIYAVKKA